ESPKRVPDRQMGQPSFVLTISDNSLLCQPEFGFQAELDVASIWEGVRVFTLTGYPSIFLGTVSLSNRKMGRK
ncbi:MAG: hypothetical protein ACE5FB_07365, partial [Candidatus Binatia bacterium]